MARRTYKQRRLSRKSRRTRQSRRRVQRGGQQINVLVKLSQFPTRQVSIEQTATLEALLAKYIDELVIDENVLPAEKKKKLQELASKKMVQKIKGPGSRNLQSSGLVAGAEYEFAVQYVKVAVNETKEQQKNIPVESVIAKLIDVWGETKIITHSSATTENIPKNVNQQFKFHKPPLSPILLIDPWFGKNLHEFYTYLKFTEYDEKEKKKGKGPSNNSEGPRIGEARYLKFYKKEAGEPLTINTVDKRISDEEKWKYLRVVEQQAHANGIELRDVEIKIACLAYALTAEQISTLEKTYRHVYGWED